VFTFRCTRKLLARLKVAPTAAPTAPTTVLGDWYCNLLFLRPQHLVLLVSERRFLPVLVPAKDLPTLAPHFRLALSDVLRSLGVPEPQLKTEDAQMKFSAFAKTASPQVLGVMTDLGKEIEYWSGSKTLLELALHVAETPCSPLPRFNSPHQETIAAFAAARQ
jgi:hypothetical protein